MGLRRLHTSVLICVISNPSILACEKENALVFGAYTFWLAFWTLINSTGYLIIGGLTSFGDVKELIALGVLTSLLSLAVGFITFVIGFIALSWILRKNIDRIVYS